MKYEELFIRKYTNSAATLRAIYNLVDIIHQNKNERY